MLPRRNRQRGDGANAKRNCVARHHRGRGGQGGVQVMTTISRVVLEVPRKRQGGVVLEPRSRLQKANALARAAILR